MDDHRYCCRAAFHQLEFIASQSSQRLQLKSFSLGLFDNKFIAQLKETLCSFSNADGGSIFLGCKYVKKGWVAEGVVLCEHEKQQFRRVLNRVVHNVVPAFRPSERQIELSFLPVRNQDAAIAGLCLIRINVHPQPRQLRMFAADLEWEGRQAFCFYVRKGKNNILFTDLTAVQDEIAKRLANRPHRVTCQRDFEEGKMLYRRRSACSRFMTDVKKRLIDQSKIRKQSNGWKLQRERSNSKRPAKSSHQSDRQSQELIEIAEDAVELAMYVGTNEEAFNEVKLKLAKLNTPLRVRFLEREVRGTAFYMVLVDAGSSDMQLVAEVRQALAEKEIDY